MAQSPLTELQLPPSGPLPEQLSDSTTPLLPSPTMVERLRHFPDEVYDTSPEGHLGRFIRVLLGDVGAGQLRKALLKTRLQQTINGTHFYLLDRFYGALFDFRRTTAELLSVNPTTQVSNDWDTEHAKDASYRSRITQFARALVHGATPTGMEMVAEAVLAVDCDVYESWSQADTGYHTYAELEALYPLYSNMEGINYGVLEGEGLPVLAGNERRVFTIRPKREVTQAEAHDVLRVITSLKPADSRCVVDWRGVEVHDPMSLRGAVSDSEYWEVVTLIKQEEEVVVPPLTPFSKHQGEAWTYNGDVAGVTPYSLNYPPVQFRSYTGNVWDVAGASRFSGDGLRARGDIISWPNNGGTNQQWFVEPVGGDRFKFVNVNSGMVLDVFMERTTDGTPLIQYPWHDGLNQQFTMVPVGDGFAIFAVHSGKVVALSNTETGATIVQQTWTGNPSQVWFTENFSVTIVLAPTQRIYFNGPSWAWGAFTPPKRSPMDDGYQDYPATDAILPLRSILVGRIVSDGILVSGAYGGERPLISAALNLDTYKGHRSLSLDAYKLSEWSVSRAAMPVFADWFPIELIRLWQRSRPVDPIEFTAGRHFWVSPTRFMTDDSVEVLEIKLTEPKLVNHLTFESSRYPHAFVVEYFDIETGIWNEIYRYNTTDSFPASRSGLEQQAITSFGGRAVGHPDHSHTSPGHWVRHSMKIPRITTDRIRIAMRRIPGIPPWLRGNVESRVYARRPTYADLPYSLAVRKSEIGYRIDNYDDLLPFKNSDTMATVVNFIGEVTMYAGRHQAAVGLLANPQEQWKSEPESFNYAVVNLHMDVRDDDGLAQTLDRFYIDPTHTGCHITIYWSNDPGEPDYTAEDGGESFFAGIAWYPIPRDYTAQKGYLHLPPTRAKWFKFEFTNLVAEPYEVFIPIKRKMRIFTPNTVEESTIADGGVGNEGRPQGVQSALYDRQDFTYRDAVAALTLPQDQLRDGSPTAAFYVRDPIAAATLRDQNWVYGFQPFTQGFHAPRFLGYQRHVYQEVEVYHSTKVAYFCGLNQLIPIRVIHQASDDTEIYSDHFDDFLNIEPGFTWTFNPGFMSSGLSNNVVAQSRPMGSLHNVQAVQFATQQTDPIQLIADDLFLNPSLSDYDWTDTDGWHRIGDAQLLYSPIDTTVRVVRNVDSPTTNLTRTLGLEQPIPSPVFSERPLTVPGADLTYGGISSGLLAYSAAGRIYAAARVVLETSLSSPLVLQLVDSTGTVLVEQEVTGAAGERLEWYVGWTIPSPLPVTPVVRVRLIQRTKSDDSWKIDALSLFDDGIVWDFSVNGGVDWYPAQDVRNNPYGILTFPSPGNQLVWRVRGLRSRVTVSSIRIRPLYSGVANSRIDGTHRGPNVSVYDHEPPIQEDPEFTTWTQPIPRTWFWATKSFPILPAEGLSIPNEFVEYYARPTTDDASIVSDGVTFTLSMGRTVEEHLDFFSPTLDTASRAGSVFNRTASEALPEPTDVAIRGVAPAETGIVAPPVHPD